jgi:transposase
MAAHESAARRITTDLAPDPEAVRAFLVEMIAKRAFVVILETIVALVARTRAMHEELIRKLHHKQRSKPPNEKLARLQLELPGFFSKPENDTAPAEKKKRKKRGANQPKAHGRPKLPEHLERVPEDVLVPEDQRACPRCGNQGRTSFFKVTEKLEVVPKRYIVKSIRREVLTCPCCETFIATAPKADEVLDRGILGEDLLVESIVDHYRDAVPFERIARDAVSQGVPLAANTLACSAGRVIDLFDPIIQHIALRCTESSYFALDATKMVVLDPQHPLGVRNASLWLFEGDHQYAFFAYAPSGHASHLENRFEGVTLSVVMADGSPTINVLEKKGTIRGGCHAHGRRGLVNALRGGDSRALEGIEIYGQLFHIEAESKRAGETIEQRFVRRRHESVPVVQKLRAWIDARRADTEPKSTLGKAVGYLHNQWTRLTAFLRVPAMDLTNNEVERDLRSWVLDRKTWLFVGHEQSARRAADALTLITTCKKMGIDPRRYLRDTLKKILEGEKSLQRLLPENYVPSG